MAVVPPKRVPAPKPAIAVVDDDDDDEFFSGDEGDAAPIVTPSGVKAAPAPAPSTTKTAPPASAPPKKLPPSKSAAAPSTNIAAPPSETSSAPAKRPPPKTAPPAKSTDEAGSPTSPQAGRSAAAVAAAERAAKALALAAAAEKGKTEEGSEPATRPPAAAPPAKKPDEPRAEMDLSPAPYEDVLEREERLGIRYTKSADKMHRKTLLRLSMPKHRTPKYAGKHHEDADGLHLDAIHGGEAPYHQSPSRGRDRSAEKKPAFVLDGVSASRQHITEGELSPGENHSPHRKRSASGKRPVPKPGAEDHFIILHYLGACHRFAIDRRTPLATICEEIGLPFGGYLSYKGQHVPPRATAMLLGLRVGAAYPSTLSYADPLEADEGGARDEVAIEETVARSLVYHAFVSVIGAPRAVPRSYFGEPQAEEYQTPQGDAYPAAPSTFVVPPTKERIGYYPAAVQADRLVDAAAPVEFRGVSAGVSQDLLGDANFLQASSSAAAVWDPEAVQAMKRNTQHHADPLWR